MFKNIELALTELKTFEQNTHNAQCVAAVKILHDFFNVPDFNLYQSLGFVFTYHGSLQYGDPRNLDTDIVIIGERIPEKAYRFFWNKELELEPIWPGNGTELSFADVNNFGNMVDDPMVDADLVAFTLSSALLYPEIARQETMHRRYKQIAWEAIKNNPGLASGVLEVLNEAVQIRKQRRGLTD